MKNLSESAQVMIGATLALGMSMLVMFGAALYQIGNM